MTSGRLRLSAGNTGSSANRRLVLMPAQAILFGAAAICAAIMCGLFAIRAHVPSVRRYLRYAVTFGLILGIVAFGAGFVIGPAIAQSPQAPLFGFILAPVAFSAGCVAGAIYCYVRTC